MTVYETHDIGDAMSRDRRKGRQRRRRQRQRQRQRRQHQATGFTGRLFFFVLTSLVLVCGRTLMLHMLREQRGDAASAGYGTHWAGVSSSRCKCSWPTYEHHAATRGQSRARSGRWERAVLHGQVSGNIPPPRWQALSTFPWTSKMCLPPGRGPDRLAGVRPQERVQQHFVDQFVDTAHALPILDVLVPLMGRTAGGRAPVL